ncbi:MAG: DPP IV N-terminal domain-containing protein, partial [Gemmatimonadales bacterium]
MLRPLALAAGLAAAPVLTAQQIDSTPLTPTRIYGTAEFAPQPFGPTQWLGDGAAYTTVEPSEDGTGLDIVRYDVETGARAVLVSAAALVPEGATKPIEIEDYTWSPDGRMLLVFTKTQPVWRLNTRGDYWVLDRTSGRLRQLGGKDAKPSTLLFAKFSPDGGRVGYVRETNLYVEDLATGAITPLTTDGSRTLINGTFDWVYEEELMNYYADGWRWSPDGRSVAYWQLNADQVKDFNLINNTDSLYSRVIPVQYPKAGEANSAARVGVVSATGGPTTWLQLEGDPREHYIARMEWAAGSTEVALQRLNRLQNVTQIILGDARTGATRVILTERDSTWVDVVNDMVWLEGGKNFTWVSERSGWRHVYLVSRDGRTMRPVTQGAFDVIEVQGIDAKGGWLYYIASPENPAQRYLFRTRLDGKGKPERLTPRTESGTHGYNRSPSFRHAIESWSYFGTPPVVRLVRLPGHQVIRTLNDNARLRARVAAIPAAPVEFTTLPADDGTPMPTWVMKPVDFDSTRTYPVLLYL